MPALTEPQKQQLSKDFQSKADGELHDASVKTGEALGRLFEAAQWLRDNGIDPEEALQLIFKKKK